MGGRKKLEGGRKGEVEGGRKERDGERRREGQGVLCGERNNENTSEDLFLMSFRWMRQ